jgi:Alpha-lytic protease prodomain/Trypsin
MDRRRVVISAVAVATVGAATALTFPALAGTDVDSGTSGAAAGPQVSAKMFAALQRDLNLTAEQAGARLEKEAWAIQTRKALAGQLGGAYGGAWLNADASQLTVAVTDPARAQVVRAAGAEPKVVARSARQLDAAKRSLDRQAKRAAASITGWYVDQATNSVVVLSTTGNQSATRSFITASGVATDAVRVVTGSQRPRLLSAPVAQQPSSPPPATDLVIRGGDAYFIDNVARCSVGFSVVEGGFVSAGHCGQAGSTTTGLAGDEEVAQGTFEAATFPESDFSFVATNDDWTPLGEVNSFGGENASGAAANGAQNAAADRGAAKASDTGLSRRFGSNRHGAGQGPGHGQGRGPGKAGATSEPPASAAPPASEAPASEPPASEPPPATDGSLPVAGSEEAPIGTSVCKFGSTTGASCGVIEALDVTVNFVDPADENNTVVVNGLIQTDVCAEAGDSGGSLLAGDQAQGMVSGGSGDCTVGGQTFFQPLNEVLETLDLTLLTTS